MASAVAAAAPAPGDERVPVRARGGLGSNACDDALSPLRRHRRQHHRAPGGPGRARGGYRGWADRFAEPLARALGSIHYANLGVRGLPARDVHATQPGPSLQMKPDLATVVAGVNDLLRPSFDADEVAGHVRSMVTALRAQGATVPSFTMPDMARVNPLARLLRGRIEAMNARLRDICEDTGARLLDLAAHELGGDPRLWDDDRLHANTLGHERIGWGLAHTAGLPGFQDWSSPLPPAPQRRLRDFVRAELHWSRAHFVPWLVRHARGQSSGEGRKAKRPSLTPFTATG